MKILVLGGSGGVGKHVLRFAAEARHDVTAIIRPTTAFDVPSGVNIVKADVMAPGVLDAMKGHDIVLSSLGIQRKNSANPWSPLASPADFCSASARLIVDAMKRHGVKRVVAVSAAGVAESAPRMNWLMKFMVARTNVGVAYRDLAVMEAVYAESGLEWLCPRPTRLTNGPRTDRTKTVDAFGINDAISRADVASWMLRMAAEPSWTGPRAPQITGG